MNAQSPEWHDEDEDDEATLAASGGAIDAIRAEAARLRSDDGAFDPSEDPTTVMAKGAVADVEPDDLDPDIAEEPTVITFDPAHDVTVIESFDDDNDLTTGAFDPSDDPTTVMAKGAVVTDDVGAPAATEPAPEVWTPAPAGARSEGSLIEGKAPPAAATSFWDRGEVGQDVVSSAAASSGKGPVPKWFIATSLLAVLMAVGLVLLVLWALSGSTA